MTGPTPLTDKINAGQAGLLDAMDTFGKLTLVELCASSGLGRTMVM
jgi:hypothetical protein